MLVEASIHICMDVVKPVAYLPVRVESANHVLAMLPTPTGYSCLGGQHHHRPLSLGPSIDLWFLPAQYQSAYSHGRVPSPSDRKASQTEDLTIKLWCF